MYAVARRNTFDPDRLAAGRAQIDEFQAIHAAQPGHRGSLLVDAGDGRWLIVNLWESERHARAAWPRLIPEVQRLLEPLMAGPSEPLGAGPVVIADLPQGAAA